MTALPLGRYFGRVAGRWSADALALSVVVHDQKRTNVPHAHEAPFVTMMLDGEYAENAARRSVAFRRFSAVYHPPQFDHQDSIGDPGVRLLILEFRAELLDGVSVDRTRFASFRDLSGSAAAWQMLSIYRDEACGDDALQFESCALHVLGALAPLLRTPRDLPSIERAREYVHARFRERITMTEIASAAGVHPVHLGQAFHRELGETVGAYVTRLRVRAAAEQLITTDAPLAAIAFDHGFCDQSHFHRVFKRLSGHTPAAFRRAFS